MADYVRAGVREAGELSAATRTWRLENFDWDDDDLGSDEETAEDQVRHLLWRIDQEKKALKAFYPAVKAKEALEQKAKIASLALPSAPATEKILLYETAIQRQLTQAMNQLERLQQAGKGQIAPPPIGVAASQ